MKQFKITQINETSYQLYGRAEDGTWQAQQVLTQEESVSLTANLAERGILHQEKKKK